MDKIAQCRRLINGFNSYHAIGKLVSSPEDTMIIVEALENLITTLEKDTPKKMLRRKDVHPSNYGMYTTEDRWCPTCKALVFSGDWSLDKQRILYKRSICTRCKQTLDWKDDDDYRE